jgi:hypothetical protein
MRAAVSGRYRSAAHEPEATGSGRIRSVYGRQPCHRPARMRQSQFVETTASTVHGPAMGDVVSVTKTRSVLRPMARPTTNVLFRISIPPDDADDHALNHYLVGVEVHGRHVDVGRLQPDAPIAFPVELLHGRGITMHQRDDHIPVVGSVA